MNLLELQQKAVGNGEMEAFCHVQVDQLKHGRTQANKPFLDIDVVDSTGRAKLKIWSDTDAFLFLQNAKRGICIELQGNFFVNQYGLNVNRPSVRALEDREVEELLAGSPSRRERVERDWLFIRQTCESMGEVKLRALCLHALDKFEKKWKRAAGARSFHHARRGGLLEHTSQMMRCAAALAPLYEEVSKDLLCAGVLFHDIGKLWENDYEEEGFGSPYNRMGEMLGHISLGVELANLCWREAKEKEPDLFKETHADLVREHLLHLIVSHHGSREFGSPVAPKTPEGWLLHHIDNIDAKIEMLRCTYAEKGQLAPGLFESRRPLEGVAILPLKLSLLGTTQVGDEGEVGK